MIDMASADAPLKAVKGEVRLGRTNLVVGPLAYGCWRFAGTDEATARAKIDAALNAGMTLIDTADIYGADGPGFGASEALLGALIGVDRGLRDRMTLATKGGIVPGLPYNSTASYITAACEASLYRLRTDHIDLYQIHRPDPLAPHAEVAAALSALRAAGKVREVGVSNYTVAQARALQAHLDFPLATSQPEFSAWTQEPIFDGGLDWAQEARCAVLAWSPLAGGSLATGTPPADADPKRFAAVMTVIDALAARENASRTAVALAFVLAYPAAMVAIIGTQNLDRIADAGAAVRVRLTRRDWFDLVEARRGEHLP